MTIQGTTALLRRDARCIASRTAGAKFQRRAVWGLGAFAFLNFGCSPRAVLGRRHRSSDAAVGFLVDPAVPRLALGGEAAPSQRSTRRRRAFAPTAGVFQGRAKGSFPRELACGIEIEPTQSALETRSPGAVCVGRAFHSKAGGSPWSPDHGPVTTRHAACAGGSPSSARRGRSQRCLFRGHGQRCEQLLQHVRSLRPG